MKRKIEWHQDCLKNMKLSLSRYIQQREDYISDIDYRINVLKEKIEQMEYQVNLAISKKKDSFDSEKFGINRKKNLTKPST